jgi:hypothetical protein
MGVEVKSTAVASHRKRNNAINRATNVLVTVLGAWLALTGSVHGVREIALGLNVPNNVLSADVGALTLLPTYMASGILTVILSVILLVWTVAFIQTKMGPAMFLGICILLVLAGGGIAQILVFIIAWALATRINKPLKGWRHVLPVELRNSISRLWLLLFIICMTLISVGVAIWLTGYVPGIHDKNMINYVTWSFLAVGFILFLVTIVSAFSKDIENQDHIKELERK